MTLREKLRRLWKNYSIGAMHSFEYELLAVQAIRDHRPNAYFHRLRLRGIQMLEDLRETNRMVSDLR